MSTPEQICTLRRRLDALLGELHALTKRRDAHLDSMEHTIDREQALVAELGRIQDRLSLLGAHSYCGCEECRPAKASYRGGKGGASQR